MALGACAFATNGSKNRANSSPVIRKDRVTLSERQLMRRASACTTKYEIASILLVTDSMNITTCIRTDKLLMRRGGSEQQISSWVLGARFSWRSLMMDRLFLLIPPTRFTQG